jgi:hypothetical protein
MNKQFEVFAKVNPNAHNVRYGRDMAAAPESVGVFTAADEWAARDAAAEDGHTYNPERGQYEWIFSHAVEL